MAGRLNLLTGQWQEEKKKKNSSPERAVGKQIDDYCKLHSIFLREIKSTGTIRNGKWTRSAMGKGISDRIGCIYPSGRFIAIELKAPGKKNTVTLDQYDFLRRVILTGGIGVLADRVDDVAKALLSSKEELLSTLKNFEPRTAKPQTQNLPEWL